MAISHGRPIHPDGYPRRHVIRRRLIRGDIRRLASLLIVSAPLLAAALSPAALAAETGPPNAGSGANWVNVSEKFTQQIGADDLDPAFLRRCQGLIVTPTGELVIQTAAKGICVSKDQGATWSVAKDNNVRGRCETGHGFSLAYPYDGRMALFSFDGEGGHSGGISLDGAKTWRSFSQILRGWSSPMSIGRREIRW
jgi:hypothetical protein